MNGTHAAEPTTDDDDDDDDVADYHTSGLC